MADTDSYELRYDKRKYDSLTTDEKLDVILGILESISYAFPDGPAKHREAHESWMASKRAETKFWEELKLDVAKKGTWGLIVILVGLILVGFSVKLGVIPK